MTTPAVPANPGSTIISLLQKFAPFDGELLDYTVAFLTTKKASVLALVDNSLEGFAAKGEAAIGKAMSSETGIVAIIATPLAAELGNVLSVIEKAGETDLSLAYDKAVSFLQIEAKLYGG